MSYTLISNSFVAAICVFLLYCRKNVLKNIYRKKHNVKNDKSYLRCPGIEPGSTAWKAAMLTTIPTSLDGRSRS